MGPRRGQEGILRRLVARPLEDELGIRMGQQPRQNAQDQIRPLLLHQASDVAEDQGLLVARQAKLPLQRQLVFRFEAEGHAVVGLGDLAILRRVPCLVVDAIEDAGEAPAQAGQEALQPTAVFLGHDFPGIGGAHRVDPVGEDDATLDEGQLLVEFQAVQSPEDLGQTQPVEGGSIKQSLIGQVVDGKDGGRAIRLAMQQGGYQPRLPVVAVDDLRPPVQQGTPQADAGDRLAEEHEAVGIVAPVAPTGVRVGIALPREMVGGIHQVGGQLAIRQPSTEDTHRLPGAGQAEVTQGPEFPQLPHGPGIGGDDEPCVMAKLPQGGGQGTGHVREAAGLDKRVGLAARKKDAAAVLGGWRGDDERLHDGRNCRSLVDGSAGAPPCWDPTGFVTKAVLSSQRQSARG